VGAGFPTIGRGRAITGTLSFGSVRESDCDDGDAERCFPIFGLFTPPMVSPPRSLGNVVQESINASARKG